MANKLLLVGSLPLDTAEDTFTVFGKPLAPHLWSMPDGEIGPRRHWISRVHYQVLLGHPDLEEVRRPRRDNGVERLHPHDHSDGWQFRVKAGVEKIVFGEPGWRLGYARDAINSYFVFKTLREKGVLPAGLKFQVSMPMVNSPIAPRTFPNLADLDKVRPGYTEALQAEVANIAAHIPHQDLVIQWDLAHEISDVYGGMAPYNSKDGAIERNLGQVRALSPRIPDGVSLGYHFCFGTLGGWPRFTPPDLGEAVCFANAVVEASGRHVDYIHIPLLDRIDDKFVAPLKDLKPKGARVYIGAVHNMERFEERIARVKKVLPDFGVGAYCGLGRMDNSQMKQVLDDHVGSSRVDLQACKLEYSIVSPK